MWVRGIHENIHLFWPVIRAHNAAEDSEATAGRSPCDVATLTYYMLHAATYTYHARQDSTIMDIALREIFTGMQTCSGLSESPW